MISCGSGIKNCGGINSILYVFIICFEKFYVKFAIFCNWLLEDSNALRTRQKKREEKGRGGMDRVENITH